MKQYLDLMRRVRGTGVFREDRTGTGTYSVFGHQMRFDLRESFPLVTTKKVFMKGIVHELLWFLKGSTNIRYLQEHGVRIWDEWARDKDNADPMDVYGEEERSISIGDAGEPTLPLTPLLPDFAERYGYTGSPRCANEGHERMSWRLLPVQVAPRGNCATPPMRW